MNSLDFIKQHVTEWPSNQYSHVSLSNRGKIHFRNISPRAHGYIIDITEHFAPSYFDGNVWTREEFEACGKPTVDWSNAPDWATCFGFAGLSKFPVWYNRERYVYIYAKGKTSDTFDFSTSLKLNVEDITHVESRPTLSTETSSNKYEREFTDRQGDSTIIDVYDVLQAFNVTCPATQHAVKKLLCTGVRGHKDGDTDLLEAREAITRAIELRG